MSLADDITRILDKDCDETRVALYNPRATVAAIRKRVEVEREPTVDDAMRVLNRDYFDDVRGIAEELKRAVKDGEVTNEEEYCDRLNEVCNDHQRVIYTFQARIGMLCTDNASACEDETGEPARSVEAAMCWALIADVNAHTDYDSIVAELEEEAEASKTA